jgi:hypothetical protein
VPARVWILWALFLVRGTFYCTMLPLWEGWDEYAHFAFLQHWIDHATLPRPEDHISREIDESMRLAPLPYQLDWIGPPYLIHEKWWALPVPERDDRRARLRSLSPALAHEAAEHPFQFYEAQQPPLYYWMASIPLRLIQARPLATRVLFLRLFGVALASLVLPFTWLAGRNIYAVAFLAIAPGLLIDAARVANDDLAIPLVALLVWLLLRQRKSWLFTGTVLGAGLLTKAYLVALIPAVALSWGRKDWKRLGAALMTAAAIAGSWYLCNLLSGRPVTGWNQQIRIAVALADIPRVNWQAAAQVSAKSFLWFGGWSFLSLKSWIYTVLELLGVVAMAGWFRSSIGTLRVPLAIAACFAAAMIYSTLGLYASTGVPNAMGWYLWPAACPLAILFAAGARRFSIVTIAALGLLDLYGVNAVMMPYYAGFVARNRVTAAWILESLSRLNVPLWLWIGYVAATIAIPLAVVRSSAVLVDANVIDIERRRKRR